MSFFVCLTQYDNLKSIHLAANGIISLFFIAEYSSIIYLYHIFIHASVRGRVGCFHVLAIVNGAAVSVGVHEHCQTRFLSRYTSKNDDLSLCVNV